MDYFVEGENPKGAMRTKEERQRDMLPKETSEDAELLQDGGKEVAHPGWQKEAAQLIRGEGTIQSKLGEGANCPVGEGIVSEWYYEQCDLGRALQVMSGWCRPVEVENGFV
ncbi:hypothetical protein NDU88_007627 [Pleurodeles waltl]|uniref:Uncharacterized protein n=1 Tax=Pleurodeles waltl TaxID=8319 RepID=A0AAV7N4L8_PLEWA|nr:hypothetical protein NDU88_007627 [Pleurodeles waltl]